MRGEANPQTGLLERERESDIQKSIGEGPFGKDQSAGRIYEGKRGNVKGRLRWTAKTFTANSRELANV